jgi:hypothetical protein
MTYPDVKAMIDGFETGTYPKTEWTHQAHFVMAFWYCYHLPINEAFAAIRQGIKKYNIAVGGQNTEDAGYHETITVFYTMQVVKFISSFAGSGNFENQLAGLLQQPFIEKNYPLSFYSKELLMSRKARKEFVKPDLYLL